MTSMHFYEFIYVQCIKLNFKCCQRKLSSEIIALMADWLFVMQV